jgi:hypothetical protein
MLAGLVVGSLLLALLPQAIRGNIENQRLELTRTL